jgi:hypothetical protein
MASQNADAVWAGLSELVLAWPKLPSEIRVSILMLLRTTKKS